MDGSPFGGGKDGGLSPCEESRLSER
jgi:hypothetical protein